MKTVQSIFRRAAAVGRGHTVLARPGLRDEARLPHHPGKEGLAQGVVDLVGARMQQVLTLQPQAEAQFLREVGAERQGRFPARVVDQQILQCIPVRRGLHDGVHGLFQFHQGGAQCLRNETAAEIAEVSFFVIHAMW